MKGLILAGGYATRLRPLSCSKPKLIFPIVGVPLVNRMVDWLRTAGVDEVILAVNHLADQLQTQISDRLNGTKVVYSIEREPLGTAGPIRLAQKILGSDEDFIVLNGDIVTNMNLNQMIKAHKGSGADATIALVQVDDPSDYGLVHLNNDSIVEKFDEKSRNVKGSGLVNAGVYVLSPEVVQRIPEKGMASIERQVFPELAREKRLNGWASKNGYWYDIGKIPDYIRANRELLEQEWSSTDRDNENEGPHYIGRDCRVEATAKVGRHSILSDNVKMLSGSSVNGSIVFEETIIGENCKVEGSIIGEKVKLESNIRIGEGSLVAGQISVPAGRTYTAHSIVLNA